MVITKKSIYRTVIKINIKEKIMKIAYVGGYWATNIGNAFFNIGADYILKEVFGKENVNMVFDQPAGIFRSGKKRGNPKKSLDIIRLLEVDFVVLLGPVISKYFLPIWKETLLDLKRRNLKYMILSAGIMKSNDKQLTEIRAFFKDFPPYLVTTRDRDAFEFLKDITPRAYDGIDFAFFVPNAHNAVKLNIDNLLVMNFDKFFEPKIKLDWKKDRKPTFVFDEQRWNLKFNKPLQKIGSKTDRFSDAFVYAISIFPAPDRPTNIGKYTVIRTDHRFTPMMKNKVFRYSNSFVADIPESYLDIYANADLTLSDRIHACVMTLAYGKYAMLFSRTNRSKLLDRVGADDITKKPVKLDMEVLTKEKENLINWLKNQF
jgi:polysaccharide pyruvyl transferase WcaK-like protein